MDRNTLLAFFLIAIVLIFTPKYMEMFAPSPQSPPLPAAENAEDTVRQAPGQEGARREKEPVVSSVGAPSDVLWSNEEKTVTVENELYTAVVSSNGGGSFLSFSFKNYLIKTARASILLMGKIKKTYLSGSKILMEKILIYLVLGGTLIRFLVVKYTGRSL